MRFIISLITILLLTSSAFAQQREVADQIVAIVNDNVILKSDVDQRLGEFMQQSQSQNFDERMWYYVLESIIDHYVLLEKAKIDSVIVSDTEVSRQLDSRINQLIQQVGSEQALERAFGQSIIEIKAEYADHFREELMVQQVRQIKSGRINITRPEVVEFYNSIPTDSLPTIPETVSLSHIVTIPPPRPEARDNAREFAEQLRDSILIHDVPLEDLARRYSDGPTASQGGGLRDVPTRDLLPELAAAAAALEPGEISEVVNTHQGFQVIRLNERRGQNLSIHHILISVQEEELDEDYATEKLTAIRDSIIYHDRSFAEMARKHSDDRRTAPAGGLLTDPQTEERYIPVNRLDPSLYRTVLLLEEIEDISEPRSYTYGEEEQRAFRIVKLNDRIEEHRANLDQDYRLIERLALQQKIQIAMADWIDDLRDDMYVEYRIPVPELDPLDMPDELAPTDAPDPEDAQQPPVSEPPVN